MEFYERIKIFVYTKKKNTVLLIYPLRPGGLNASAEKSANKYVFLDGSPKGIGRRE